MFPSKVMFNGGGRNTGPVGMAGGAQDAAETKKVLRQLVCPFPTWRSYRKTNDAITHIQRQP